MKHIGGMYVNTYGNGKMTFYVGEIGTDYTIKVVEDTITLTSSTW